MKTKTLTLAIIYASIYSAISLLLTPLSFGSIQVRIAGLMLGAIPFLGLAGVIGQTLGCFITNSFSPLGLIDMINVIPTCVMAFVIWKLKNKSVIVGLSSYALVTSLSIGFALNYAFSVPYLFTVATVLIGQIISCVIGGFVVYKAFTKVQL